MELTATTGITTVEDNDHETTSKSVPRNGEEAMNNAMKYDRDHHNTRAKLPETEEQILMTPGAPADLEPPGAPKMRGHGINMLKNRQKDRTTNGDDRCPRIDEGTVKDDERLFDNIKPKTIECL